MCAGTDLIPDLYLRAELHQQLCCVGTVGGQAAHRCAEVRKAGDGFTGLGASTGPFGVSRAGCGAGGETGASCCCQTHQPDQSPDVCQTQRLQTSRKAAARATVEPEGRQCEGKEEGWCVRVCVLLVVLKYS